MAPRRAHDPHLRGSLMQTQERRSLDRSRMFLRTQKCTEHDVSPELTLQCQACEEALLLWTSSWPS
eukprot:13777625-Heterocapsa_arctica.AAC.1